MYILKYSLRSLELDCKTKCVILKYINVLFPCHAIFIIVNKMIHELFMSF